MDETTMKLPESGHESALTEIREKLRNLERRDWWLWGTAVTILLLLSSALFVMEIPVLFRPQDVQSQYTDIAVRGLFGLVLLFSVFAIYQQVLIKQLRSRMASQIGVMAALQTRAEMFEKLAILDPLTGLFNRRFASERLPAEIARALRFSHPFTLLMLDLNGLKQINDQYGHVAGDMALREFAHALKRCIRSSDLPVRVGGDEFMVLLPECRAYSVPLALARLQGASVETGGTRIPLTFAAGWAEFQPGEAPEELMHRADLALYSDKRTGRAAKQVEQAEADVRQGQKMQVVGQMAGRVVHDFNNLLTVIKGYSELVLAGLDPGDPNHGRLDDIRKAANHAAQLTAQLLAFTRREHLQTRVVDLNEQLAAMESLVRPMLGEQVELVVCPGRELHKIRVQPGQVEQVIINLATNARDAIAGSGVITIETENVTLDEPFVRAHPGSRPGSYVRLTFADTGAGIAPEIRSRIFDPFFTTKPAGKGTGLGLATVYGTVKQVGGYIVVESEPARGSRFSIYFPRFAEAEPYRPVAVAGSETGPVVLVVENEEALRTLTCEYLKSEGFRPIAAASPSEGLRLAADFAGVIDVAVTDVVLPGNSCRELRDALLAGRSGLKMLFIGGYSDLAAPYRDIVGDNFLETPFSAQELARKIRALCEPVPEVAAAGASASPPHHA